MVPAEVLPPATSASQLTSYTRCPRAYAARYVYGFEPEFRSLNLILGSAIHGAVGWWFEERLAGRSPTVAGAESVLAADLAAGTTEAPIRWKDATPVSLEADARRFLRAYLAAYGELPVAAVEVPFDVPLADPVTGEVFGRNVRGYFDLVLEDGTIIELKTSAKGWSPFDLERHLQLGAYVHATNMQGELTTVIAHVIVKLKRDTPRVEAHAVLRSAQENRWWLPCEPRGDEGQGNLLSWLPNGSRRIAWRGQGSRRRSRGERDVRALPGGIVRGALQAER